MATVALDPEFRVRRASCASTRDQSGAGRRAPFSDDREGYHSNAGGSVLDDSVGYARSHAGVTDEEPCSTERYTSAPAFQRLAAVLGSIRTRAHLSGPNARNESIAESLVDAKSGRGGVGAVWISGRR